MTVLRYLPRTFCHKVEKNSMSLYVNDWKQQISSRTGVKSRPGIKLRLSVAQRYL